MSRGYSRGKELPPVDERPAQWRVTERPDGKIMAALVPNVASIEERAQLSRAQGYTGDCCSNCSMFTMRRNGTCLVCDMCGTTTGCS